MDKVQIVEVGPRDGLQNEKEIVPVAAKIQLIDKLVPPLPLLSVTAVSKWTSSSLVKCRCRASRYPHLHPQPWVRCIHLPALHRQRPRSCCS